MVPKQNMCSSHVLNAKNLSRMIKCPVMILYMLFCTNVSMSQSVQLTFYNRTFFCSQSLFRRHFATDETKQNTFTWKQFFKTINSGTKAWNEKIIRPSENILTASPTCLTKEPLWPCKRRQILVQRGSNNSERGESCVWSDGPEQRGSVFSGETAANQWSTISPSLSCTPKWAGSCRMAGT